MSKESSHVAVLEKPVNGRIGPSSDRASWTEKIGGLFFSPSPLDIWHQNQHKDCEQNFETARAVCAAIGQNTTAEQAAPMAEFELHTHQQKLDSGLLVKGTMK